MNIKLGMPEILIIFSTFMYSQSFSFAITAFVLGVFARVFDYVMEFQAKQNQAASVKEGVDDVTEILKGIFKTDE